MHIVSNFSSRVLIYYDIVIFHQGEAGDPGLRGESGSPGRHVSHFFTTFSNVNLESLIVKVIFAYISFLC